MKAEFWKIFDDIDAEPGPAAQAVAATGPRRPLRGPAYPASVDCLRTTSSTSSPTCASPREHRHRIRHSNFIERTFGETRRRVKVIGRLPGERSCLTGVTELVGRPGPLGNRLPW